MTPMETCIGYFVDQQNRRLAEAGSKAKIAAELGDDRNPALLVVAVHRDDVTTCAAVSISGTEIQVARSAARTIIETTNKVLAEAVTP